MNLQERFILTIHLAAAAVAFGFLGGTACNFATQLKFLLGYDDALDVRAFFPLSFLVVHSGLDLRYARYWRYRWKPPHRPLRAGQRRWIRRGHRHFRWLVGQALHPACPSTR